jgi:hypothetical protein
VGLLLQLTGLLCLLNLKRNLGGMFKGERLRAEGRSPKRQKAIQYITLNNYLNLIKKFQIYTKYCLQNILFTDASSL